MLVTLYTRVWIEIMQKIELKFCKRVTLYTRVWIEIFYLFKIWTYFISHPLHEGVD